MQCIAKYLLSSPTFWHMNPEKTLYVWGPFGQDGNIFKTIS